jgi:hypothetical protein
VKITKSQLKQIIKEEIGEIDEGLFDKVATYFGGGSREKKAKRFLEMGMEELRDGGSFPWGWAINQDIIRGQREGGKYEQEVWHQSRLFLDKMTGHKSYDKKILSLEKDGGLPDVLLYPREKKAREEALEIKRKEEEEYEAGRPERERQRARDDRDVERHRRASEKADQEWEDFKRYGPRPGKGQKGMRKASEPARGSNFEENLERIAQKVEERMVRRLRKKK